MTYTQRIQKCFILRICSGRVDRALHQAEVGIKSAGRNASRKRVDNGQTM